MIALPVVDLGDGVKLYMHVPVDNVRFVELAAITSKHVTVYIHLSESVTPFGDGGAINKLSVAFTDLIAAEKFVESIQREMAG
jgi:hypothetical protein